MQIVIIGNNKSAKLHLLYFSNFCKVISLDTNYVSQDSEIFNEFFISEFNVNLNNIEYFNSYESIFKKYKKIDFFLYINDDLIEHEIILNECKKILNYYSSNFNLIIRANVIPKTSQNLLKELNEYNNFISRDISHQLFLIPFILKNKNNIYDYIFPIKPAIGCMDFQIHKSIIIPFLKLIEWNNCSFFNCYQIEFLSLFHYTYEITQNILFNEFRDLLNFYNIDSDDLLKYLVDNYHFFQREKLGISSKDKLSYIDCLTKIGNDNKIKTPLLNSLSVSNDYHINSFCFKILDLLFDNPTWSVSIYGLISPNNTHTNSNENINLLILEKLRKFSDKIYLFNCNEDIDIEFSNKSSEIVIILTNNGLQHFSLHDKLIHLFDPNNVFQLNQSKDYNIIKQAIEKSVSIHF